MKKITFLFFVLFAFSVNAQTETQKIQEYLNSNYSTLGITSQDINDWYVESEATSSSTGITNYYVKQRYQGIEIYNAISNLWFKEDKIINFGNRFISNISSKVNATTPNLSVIEGLISAKNLLNIATSNNHNIIESEGNKKFKISN